MNNGISDLREFGSRCRLDVGKKVLWCEEKPVPLPLKAIELLSVLVEKKGEVVTKDEIWQNVWRDAFVEETNLTHNVYLLRKTLNDLGEKNLIQTVPRRGYRFTGKVREIEAGEIVIEKHTHTQTLIEIEEAGEQGRKAEGEKKTFNLAASPVRRVAFVGLLSLLIGIAAFFGFQYWNDKTSASEIRSIAVLPFKTIGTEAREQRQDLGLTDVLITRLSNIKEINVRPTSAVLNLTDEDSAAIGKNLQVDAVLEGTIHRTGDKVRITSRLVKTSDNSIVWSGQFEKFAAEEFSLQNEIALQLANALEINLSNNEKNALAKRYTENADAYRLYTAGRFHWNKRDTAGMLEAARLFRNAIEKDPNFALAYVGLADTLGTRQDATEAAIAVRRAIQLDPNLAEAHASFGFLLMFHEWEWTKAEESFKRSIELNPNYATAHHWYATLLSIQGKQEEAKAEMRRALEINPQSYNFLADLGQIYYFNREYKEAEDYCRKALAIYPEFIFAHIHLAHIYRQTGDYEKSLEADMTAANINESFVNDFTEWKKKFDDRLNGYKDSYLKDGYPGYLKNRITAGKSTYNNAIVYSFLGEKEKALDNLERAFDDHTFMLAFVKADPVFDPLRDEPRFRELLRRMKLDN